MAKVNIEVCDFCGQEQRSDEKVYWAQRFGGPVVIDFKRVPGCQVKQTYETSCRACASDILEAVNSAILKIKKEAK